MITLILCICLTFMNKWEHRMIMMMVSMMMVRVMMKRMPMLIDNC